jgi:hypothetical protein
MINTPFKRASDWIARRYSFSLMSVLLLAAGWFFWQFNFSSLPVSNRALVKLSGHDGLLDLRLYYTAQEAFTALSHYGEAGRGLYVKFLAADFIFIPIYSLGLGFLMTRLVRAAFHGAPRRLWLNLLPLGVGALDATENVFILIMLGLYPNSNVLIGTLAGITTFCKYLLTFCASLCLLYLIFMLAWHRGRPRRRAGPRST